MRQHTTPVGDSVDCGFWANSPGNRACPSSWAASYHLSTHTDPATAVEQSHCNAIYRSGRVSRCDRKNMGRHVMGSGAHIVRTIFFQPFKNSKWYWSCFLKCAFSPVFSILHDYVNESSAMQSTHWHLMRQYSLLGMAAAPQAVGDFWKECTCCLGPLWRAC